MMRFLLALLMSLIHFAHAGPLEEAEYTLTKILYEEDVVNVYYSVTDSGRVTILFGAQVPDWKIKPLLKKLEQEPAIKGVTSTKTDKEFCSIR